MYYYLCSFMYCDDGANRYSAHICDQVGKLCLITSTNKNLEDPKFIQEIKEDYRISEILEQEDCEEIRIEQITEVEFNEYKEDKLEILEYLI